MRTLYTPPQYVRTDFQRWRPSELPQWYLRLLYQTAASCTAWKRPQCSGRSLSTTAHCPIDVSREQAELCRRLRRVNVGKWTHKRLAKLLGVDTAAVRRLLTAETKEVAEYAA
jgi:hypothetical protein